MASKKDAVREQLIDGVQRLFVMGFKKPYQIMKLLPAISDFRTADNYLRIAQRRLHRSLTNINHTEEIKKQVQIMDQAIGELWAQFLVALEVNEKVSCVNAIERLLKSKAELLGLEAPKELKVQSQDSLWDILQKMPENEREQIIKSIDAYSGKQKPTA